MSLQGMIMEKSDVLILGGGPGGYVAAIRASQLGKRVTLIEKDALGGVCLNRGCIPTKALLKSAHCVHELKSLKSLGINIELQSLDPAVAVKRANSIATRVSKGVEFLMKKNNIQVVKGEGKLTSVSSIDVDGTTYQADKIIIATGAHYKSFPGLEHDGDRLIGAWEALKMEELPESIAIIGAGAIGVEFAYFYKAFGVDVHIFEMQSHLLPLEDDDCSVELERAYKKQKIKMTLGFDSLSVKNSGEAAVITYSKGDKSEEINLEKCLIAVGMTGSIDGIGLEEIGVKTEKGFIVVDEMYKTSVDGVYAIGDVAGPPLLAHSASHEGIIAVESICEMNPHSMNKMNIAGCTYCQPQVASVGATERELKADGVDYKVGKMFFRANGKAIASNETDGFSKVLLDSEGKILGAHIVGNNATELIHEYVLFKSMNGIDEQIINTVHPHPTLGEWLAETVMAAKGRALHA